MAMFDRTITEEIEAPAHGAGLRGGGLQGLVRCRGVEFGEAGSGWRFERRTPVALLISEGHGASRRVDLPQRRANPLPLLAPVVVYVVARSLLRRRRST